MTKFIPYEKLSKKEKRKADLARRTTWDVNPVTRRSENPRAYDRKKADRTWREPETCLPFVLRPNNFRNFSHVLAPCRIFTNLPD